jgi:hypothetical protein
MDGSEDVTWKTRGDSIFQGDIRKSIGENILISVVGRALLLESKDTGDDGACACPAGDDMDLLATTPADPGRPDDLHVHQTCEENAGHGELLLERKSHWNDQAEGNHQDDKVGHRAEDTLDC